MVIITDVLPKSRAERVGILSGDVLVSINGKEINDVLDYRFHLANREIALTVLREGAELSFRIVKKEYDDIGLDFETPLMDKKHSCRNKCIFCFMDQLPPNVRSTMLFKDDDVRLSFLQGNYVTLTNLTDEEIEYYVDTYQPMDKAGAYGVQEWIGYIGVENIQGSYFNVMGLPVQRLYTELKKF